MASSTMSYLFVAPKTIIPLSLPVSIKFSNVPICFKSSALASLSLPLVKPSSSSINKRQGIPAAAE